MCSTDRISPRATVRVPSAPVSPIKEENIANTHLKPIEGEGIFWSENGNNLSEFFWGWVGVKKWMEEKRRENRSVAVISSNNWKQLVETKENLHRIHSSAPARLTLVVRDEIFVVSKNKNQIVWKKKSVVQLILGDHTRACAHTLTHLHTHIPHVNQLKRVI